MAITPIFDPRRAGRPMRVAAFMSGSGTNVRKLIQRESAFRTEEAGAPPFEIAFIFSDRSDGECAGERIAYENGLPYFSYDTRVFHRLQGVKRSVRTPAGMAARKVYDGVAQKLVAAFDIDVIALAGYMSYITLGRCVNVHPADLSLCTPEGKRKYVGDAAVRDAIVAGEMWLRASTLWTDEGVDTGPLLMVSPAVPVELPGPLAEVMRQEGQFHRIVEAHQARLKEAGDWRIFPRTIEMIAQGRFALDEKNRVYVDGSPVPEGYRE